MDSCCGAEGDAMSPIGDDDSAHDDSARVELVLVSRSTIKPTEGRDIQTDKPDSQQTCWNYKPPSPDKWMH